MKQKRMYRILILIFILFVKGQVMAKNYKDIIQDCPKSPNCVSTMTDQSDKLMSPISFESQPDTVQKLILEVLKSLDRVEVKANEGNWIHAVFKTAIFRFKDDVYFYIDSEKNEVHFKSQSRTGYSDLGKNRSRMEKLSQLIKTKLTE